MSEHGEKSVLHVSVDVLDANPFQPRRTFNEQSEKFVKLCASVRREGILQPLQGRVHPNLPGRYQLLFGERRLRAARKVGLSVVPFVVENWNDDQMADLSIHENYHREDLPPIDEALAFQARVDRYGGDFFEAGKALGIRPEVVKERCELLLLAPQVKQWVNQRELSLGCAAELLLIQDEKEQVKFARLAMTRGLSPAKLRGAMQRFVRKPSAEHSKKTRPRKAVTEKILVARLVQCSEDVVQFDRFDTVSSEMQEALVNQVDRLVALLQEFKEELIA